MTNQQRWLEVWLVVYMVWALLAASEATTASKQPWRSNLSMQVKLGTQMCYAINFQDIFVTQLI